MPTNQEWLNQLATESPDKLKAWFDAEHNDNLAAEKVVNDDAVDVTTEKRTKTEHDGVAAEHEADNTSNKSSENVTDSREKLEADVYKYIAISITPNKEDDGVLAPYTTVLEWLDRQAAITNAAWKQLKESWITAHDSLLIENGELRDEVDRLQRRNDELRTSYDKLKRERDNLADDLLACNREREQLRKHLGIALDHAHDICSLVDIDGNVLDVGD